MSGLMEQMLTHHVCRCQNKSKISRPRHLHQSTLSLGDAAACYSTTHTQSYSGRSADGRPLVFHLRDPSFPSQHLSHLDLSGSSLCQTQTHRRADVHGPQHMTPKSDLKAENWARHRGGLAVKEITNPQDPSEYWTTYRTELTVPVAGGSTPLAGGRPTQWHQHDILTGEQRQAAAPGRESRRSRDKLLWASRRWETDCCSLRLC